MGHCMVGNWMGNSMMGNGGSHSMVGNGVNCWCGVVHKWCGVVHNRGSMVHNWGSMVHNWGSMVNRWGSVNRSLIIDCLSSVSHFLDHPISTIVVSHSLHSSIGQCNGVRAGGGVAISGLLLLEVGPAVVVVDPVLVGICRRLAQVLVGSWGSLVLRGSQTTADKGQQQGNLHRGTTHR